MSQSEIKLDDVQMFVEVVRAQSFSGAGRKLALPKSTVSRRIADLEEALGTRLFERTPAVCISLNWALVFTNAQPTTSTT